MPAADSTPGMAKTREYLRALKGEALWGSIFGFLTAAALVFLVEDRLPVNLAGAALGGVILLHVVLNLLQHLATRARQVRRSEPRVEIGISPFTWAVIGSTALFFSLALSLGFWLAGQDRPLVLVWGFGAIALGLAHILLPPRCRRLGLGQILLFLGFGPFLSLGVHYALSGIFTPASALVGLPQALLLTAFMGAEPVSEPVPGRKKAKEKKQGQDKPGQFRAPMWSHLILSFLALAALFPLVWAARLGMLPLVGLAVAPLALRAALELKAKDLNAKQRRKAGTKTLISYLALSLLLLAALAGERFLRN